MFKCCDCGKEFEKPKIIREKREFWGMPCYEEFGVCPYCEEGDYEEIENEEDD